MNIKLAKPIQFWGIATPSPFINLPWIQLPQTVSDDAPLTLLISHFVLFCSSLSTTKEGLRLKYSECIWIY